MANARRIAVTGASGFVGRVLVERLREAGREVVALSRADGVDYEDGAAMARRFEGADAVIHLAARAHRGGGDDEFAPNIRIAEAAARAARSARVRRFVLVSSIGVNGNVTPGRAFTEADAPAPVEPYARSKWRAEQAVRAALEGSPTTLAIVRPPLVYGPDAPGNMGRLVQAVTRGWPLPLASVRNRRSLVGIDNLSDVLLLCAERDEAAGELFLVADREVVSTPDIVRAIANGLGRRPRLWPVPVALLDVAASALGRRRIVESLCHSLEVDASKARRVLGWQPAVTTQDGLARAAREWSLP